MKLVTALLLVGISFSTNCIAQGQAPRIYFETTHPTEVNRYSTRNASGRGIIALQEQKNFCFRQLVETFQVVLINAELQRKIAALKLDLKTSGLRLAAVFSEGDQQNKLEIIAETFDQENDVIQSVPVAEASLDIQARKPTGNANHGVFVAPCRVDGESLIKLMPLAKQRLVDAMNARNSMSASLKDKPLRTPVEGPDSAKKSRGND